MRSDWADKTELLERSNTLLDCTAFDDLCEWHQTADTRDILGDWVDPSSDCQGCVTLTVTRKWPVLVEYVEDEVEYVEDEDEDQFNMECKPDGGTENRN